MALTKVTTGTIASGTITSSNIEDGTIVNADVNTSAAIASTKLSGVESGLTSVQTFTSSGTWTKPTGITKVVLEVQGAGGGGSAGGIYGGGAGGGYAKKLLDVSSISTATITVGALGAGASANAGAGSAGGASSWSDGTNTITGNGGAGGNASTTADVTGATGVGGDINIQGGRGHYTWHGGGSMFSTDFGGANSNQGLDAVGYGGGGGNGYTTYPAGDGGPGIVIVWEYK